MSYKIIEIEGIGAKFAERLQVAAIYSTNDLLKACGSRKGRDETAEKTGISASQLLKWTNMADLMRVSGIGEEFSELLEAAGVDTVKELATQFGKSRGEDERDQRRQEPDPGAAGSYPGTEVGRSGKDPGPRDQLLTPLRRQAFP